MRFFSTCLLVVGLAIASLSQGAEDPPEGISVEDYDDLLQASEDSQTVAEDNFQEALAEDVEVTIEEDAEVAFKMALRQAFKTWNSEVRACNGDVACLARANNKLRPMVNEAADSGELAVVDPCEDRVGTYLVETVDGWTMSATLPC